MNEQQTVTTNISSPKIELSDFLENEPPEVVEAKQLAKRYRLPYIDLLPADQPSPIDYEELAKIPVDMMLRNHFVPLKREGSDLHAAMDRAVLDAYNWTDIQVRCEFILDYEDEDDDGSP